MQTMRWYAREHLFVLSVKVFAGSSVTDHLSLPVAKQKWGRLWGIKFERAVVVDAGIRIIPKSEDDYRRIIRLFSKEEVPHHTFPLPPERNIHAVIRGVHATLSEIEIKEELQQRGYSPLHIIRLKRAKIGRYRLEQYVILEVCALDILQADKVLCVL
ncbi:unnamed protein product [Acanthoscelides obtectus]|uniref:Uncharacterized protein n=1 Tax=Acanthoscelides obtectus TaxID=200917 RepID=A0A9P0L517_ACAOB|nr:unnamed protein product [Acanthoscelides obtectus]CAK1662223.1 hypothetical protein AOBTE_LOCUS23042 [Acanthoscelides obtectus]